MNVFAYSPTRHTSDRYMNFAKESLQLDDGLDSSSQSSVLIRAIIRAVISVNEEQTSG